MPTFSVIEPQHTKLTAILLSHTSLLVRELGNQLQQQQIDTELIYLPSAAGDSSQYPRFPTEKFQPSLTSLKVHHLDYLFYLYPSLGAINPSEYERFFATLPRHCKIVLIDDYRSQNRLQLLTASLVNHDYRLILLTDPFGPFFPPQDTNPVLKLLTQLINRQSLVLEGDGQTELFPTFTQDIVDGVIKALFNAGTKGQTFYLSTLEPVTQLDLAHRLRLISSDLLDFTPPLEYQHHTSPGNFPPDQNLIASTQAQLNWIPNSHLEPSLNHSLSLIKEWFQKGSPDTNNLSPASNTLTAPAYSSSLSSKVDSPSLSTLPKGPSFQSSPKKTHFLHTYFFSRRFTPLKLILLFLLFAFILPPLLLFFSISHGSRQLTQAYSQLEQGRPLEAKQLAQSAESSLLRSRTLLGLNRRLFFFVFQKKFSQYDQFLDAGARLAQSFVLVADSTTQAQTLFDLIIGKNSLDFETQNSLLKSSLDGLYNHLSLLDASVQKLDITSNLSEFNALGKLKDKLPDLLTRVELGINLTKVLPALINTPNPQTYLVLIQNNSELRPTGGFISAYSLVTFKDGRVADIQTEDIYSADAQLNGQVVPPEPLRAHLGEENWYLRDSNWSPHFPSAARQAQWFLGKELNRQVDGVVGLNLFTLSSLLEATGPLTVPNQLNPISASTLAEIVEYSSQPDPRNPQNTEILTPITTTLFNTLAQGNIALIDLISSLDESLSNSQLLLYHQQEDIQAFFESQNWAGTLANPTCPPRFDQQNCTPQTFALIEANLGVNRTNYFLGRRLNHQLDIGDSGSLTHTLTIEYQNNSPDNSWPAGRYKTYTRLYAPLYSELVSLTLDGQPLDATSIPDLDLGLQEIAFLHEIPAAAHSTLIITLRSAQILPPSSSSTLTLNWQKQSGTTADPLTFKLLYSDSLLPTQINQVATINPTSLNFSTQLAADTSLAIQFQQQP